MQQLSPNIPGTLKKVMMAMVSIKKYLKIKGIYGLESGTFLPLMII
jgi:hypothetical protein